MSETFYDASNLSISNGFGRNRDRYYLEEYFKQRPAVNGNIDQVYTEEVARAANKDFELLGTNMTTALCTFSSTVGGIKLTTAGADNDQAIVLPHLDTTTDSTDCQSAWNGIKWGTENQVEWECAIRTGNSIALTSFWAGLKLTNTGAYATDNNQAYFLYAADDDQGALTTNANLHFVYSVAGTDYITDLGITVAVNTTYKFRIAFDSDRKISIFVADGTNPMTQYGLVTSATAGGATQSTASTKSNAMTNDTDLIPYVGVQAHTGSAKDITLCYEKISRTLA